MKGKKKKKDEFKEFRNNDIQVKNVAIVIKTLNITRIKKGIKYLGY